MKSESPTREDIPESSEALIKKLDGLVKIQALIRGFLARKNSKFKPSKDLKSLFNQKKS